MKQSTSLWVGKLVSKWLIYSKKQVITFQIDGWILQIDIKNDLLENIQLAAKVFSLLEE